MTPDIAKDILIFLGRVDLKGTEAQRFLQCVEALLSTANRLPPEPVAPETNAR